MRWRDSHTPLLPLQLKNANERVEALLVPVEFIIAWKRRRRREFTVIYLFLFVVVVVDVPSEQKCGN